MKKSFVVLCVVVLCVGCASSTHYDFSFDENKSIVKTKYYEAKISIRSTGGLFPMNSYKLDIINLSDKDIEIDWNKTQFIINGQTDGGFMFEGVRYVARENVKNTSFVLAKSSFSKFIYPNYLVSYYLRGWRNMTIPDGETGVLVTLKIGNNEVREKLFITKVTKIVPNI